METSYQKLGNHAEMWDLVGLGVKVTPQYDPYEDKLQDAKTFHMLCIEPDVTPEWKTNM